MQGGAGATCGGLHIHMLGPPGDMGVLYERNKKKGIRERRRHENNMSSQQHHDKDRNDTHTHKNNW